MRPIILKQHVEALVCLARHCVVHVQASSARTSHGLDCPPQPATHKYIPCKNLIREKLTKGTRGFFFLAASLRLSSLYCHYSWDSRAAIWLIDKDLSRLPVPRITLIS